MEYWFPAGLILQPARYHDGLNPASGLSETDKQWVKRFYPALPDAFPTLEPFQTRTLTLKPGEQAELLCPRTSHLGRRIRTDRNHVLVTSCPQRVGPEKLLPPSNCRGRRQRK
jgi:hypothetical protein